VNRKERKQQKKKRERQERLRQEKHVRVAPPIGPDEGDAKNQSGRSPVDRPAPVQLLPHTPTSARRVASKGEQLAEQGPVADPAVGDRVAKVPDGPLDNYFVGRPAREWLEALQSGTDTTPILRALEPAEFVPGELLLKASVCCEILVAAELVAAGLGRPSLHLPAGVAAWLQERDVLFSPGVVRLAAAAVHRVGEFSELRQLWDAVHLGKEWVCGVAALCGRLQW
jgi:hypothetical protein